MQPCSIIFYTEIAVVDVENFSGGFSFTKMPAKLEDQKKKSHQQLFESFFYTQQQVYPLAQLLNQHTNHTSR